jgi:hypothetical protein
VKERGWGQELIKYEDNWHGDQSYFQERTWKTRQDWIIWEHGQTQMEDERIYN